MKKAKKPIPKSQKSSTHATKNIPAREQAIYSGGLNVGRMISMMGDDAFYRMTCDPKLYQAWRKKYAKALYNNYDRYLHPQQGNVVYP